MSGAPQRRVPAASGTQLAIDYLPLLVFFAVNFLTPGDGARELVGRVTGSLGDMTRLEAIMVARVIVATGAFVVATALVRDGRVLAKGPAGDVFTDALLERLFDVPVRVAGRDVHLLGWDAAGADILEA